MANWTNLALVLIPRSSIMLYLWKATVRGVIARVRAISFMVRPSASSCRTSRCRMLKGPLPRPGPEGLRGEFGVFADSQEDHPDLGHQGLELPGGVEPVEPRHSDVEHDDV